MKYILYIIALCVVYLIAGLLFQVTWNASFFEAGLVDREIGFGAAVCTLYAVSFIGGAWNFLTFPRRRDS